MREDCTGCVYEDMECYEEVGSCTEFNKYTGRESVKVEAPAGSKYDAGLVDMSYLDYFPLALEAVCRVSTFGADKGYARGSFADVPNARVRYTAAMIRHYLKEGPVTGEPAIDPESGLHHDLAVAWNALCRVELRLREDQ